MALEYESPDWEAILDAEDEDLADAWEDNVPTDTGLLSDEDVVEDPALLKKIFAKKDVDTKQKYRMYYDQVSKVKTRYYLDCSKEEFEEAKSLGAYYDAETDKMFYLGTQRASRFEKWPVVSVVKE